MAAINSKGRVMRVDMPTEMKATFPCGVYFISKINLFILRVVRFKNKDQRGPELKSSKDLKN